MKGKMTPYGFVASLAFLLWALVAGIALFLRPADCPAAATAGASPATRSDPALIRG